MFPKREIIYYVNTREVDLGFKYYLMKILKSSKNKIVIKLPHIEKKSTFLRRVKQTQNLKFFNNSFIKYIFYKSFKNLNM